MDDVFGVKVEVSNVEDLLKDVRNLYLSALRDKLMEGCLSVDELIKLGRYLLPNPDLLYRVEVESKRGGSEVKDIRSLLKVVNE